ncbi:MAG: hypothetical protein ACP5XB_02925 [Isosphaeraceae bacterium]
MSQSEMGPPGSTALAGGSNTNQPVSPVRVWVLTLAAGLIAGLASGTIEEVVHARHGRQSTVVNTASSSPFVAGKEAEEKSKVLRAAENLETTLIFGSLGAMLGLALGFAGGAARGSAPMTMAAASGGLILGAAVGVAAIKVVLPVYNWQYLADSNDLIMGILCQIALAMVLGASGGAAFGAGLEGSKCALRAALGGLLGAAAGALIHGLVVAFAFPLARTSSLISEMWGTRLFALLAVVILASAGAASGALYRAGARDLSPGSPKRKALP